MSIGLYIVLAPLYLKSVRKLQEKRFVFVKILAIIIPENGAKVSKIKCFQFAQQTLNKGIIDIAQLHGVEDENEINQLRALTDKPIIKAFCIKKSEDITNAESCLADYILLDSGEGTGTVFDWKKIQNIQRPYFLAGGLSIDNVENAVETIKPVCGRCQFRH